MDSDKLVVESDLKKSSFIEHLFNFDNDSKSEMMNILQYTVIAIIPVILLNKGVSKIIPSVDSDNTSLVLTAEILGQSFLMFLGMLLIHRLVTYFPTYSKKPYATFHVTNIILVFLIIVASFQTRIGEKTNILIDRLFDLIEGRTTMSNSKTETTHAQSNTQSGQHPQTMPQQRPQTMPQHQPSRADMSHSGTTDISQLHGNEVSGQSPDFNSMFSGPNNPMVNAKTPGMAGQEAFTQEPMAANEFSGGMLNAY